MSDKPVILVADDRKDNLGLVDGRTHEAPGLLAAAESKDQALLGRCSEPGAVYTLTGPREEETI